MSDDVMRDDEDFFLVDEPAHEPSERAWIEKKDWGPGPWQDEPDELEWNYGDVMCRIVRHPYHGTLNGYVALPHGHPWRGLDSDEMDVDVHGGLTWAGELVNSEMGKTFATRTNDLFWIGFDCAHAQDLMPGMDAMMDLLGRPRMRISLSPNDPWAPTYKTLDYVRAEVESLARQSIDAMKAR